MSPASSPHRQDWLHTVLRACQNLCFVYSWQVLGGCTDDYAQILDKCSAWAAKYQTDQLQKRRQHGYLVPGESPRKVAPSTIGLGPELPARRTNWVESALHDNVTPVPHEL